MFKISVFNIKSLFIALVSIGTNHSYSNEITQLESGYYYNLALDSEGSLWGWGDNSYGQLANEEYSQANFPINLEGHTWLKIWAGPEHAIGMATDSTIYAWGLNDNGQLGDSTTTNRFEPTEIHTDQQFVDFSIGEHHTIAIANDSSLWAWGDNSQGQLGLDHKVDSLSPTLVDDTRKYIKVGAGSEFSIAVDETGDLYVWGNGRYYITGQGSGNTTDLKVPTLLIEDSIIVDLNTSYRGVQAIASDGRVFGWGYNSHTRMGNENTTVLYIPTRIEQQEGYNFIELGSYNGASIRNDTLTIWDFIAIGSNLNLGLIKT